MISSLASAIDSETVSAIVDRLTERPDGYLSVDLRAGDSSAAVRAALYYLGHETDRIIFRFPPAGSPVR